MAQGLALPVGVNKYGRARTVAGWDQTQKLIGLHCSPGESGNPFQAIGINEAIIFAPSRSTGQARALQHIQRVFQRFEKAGRAKLVTGYPVFTVDSGRQEATAEIKAVDLETDKQDEPHDIKVVMGRSPFGGG